MKAIEKTVYYCGFCKYYSLSGSATSRHEKYCTCNPNNWHACFHYCKHLVKTDIPSVIEMDDEDGPTIKTPKRTEFRCSLYDKKLYSFKAEKKGLLKNGYLDDCERMPLECEGFENIYKDDSDFFNSDMI